MIELINQHDDKSCGTACMAMITGHPYQDLLDDDNNYYHMSDCLKKLKEAGIDAFVVIGTGYFVEDTILMAVPSLNMVGSMHWVVFEKGVVYDPQAGRDGRKAYKSVCTPMGVGDMIIVKTKYAEEYAKRLLKFAGLVQG